MLTSAEFWTSDRNRSWLRRRSVVRICSVIACSTSSRFWRVNRRDATEKAATRSSSSPMPIAPTMSRTSCRDRAMSATIGAASSYTS